MKKSESITFSLDLLDDKLSEELPELSKENGGCQILLSDDKSLLIVYDFPDKMYLFDIKA